jgi:signal transduction histidine kinase/ActR/RegA family two-component response regulator
MLGVLRHLSRIGVTEDLPERETRQIVFLNTLTLAIIPFIVLALLLNSAYLPATRLPIIVGALNLVCLSLTLLWTHLRHYLFARVWIAAVTIVFVTLATALVGTETRMHFFMIGFFFIFCMFPAEERPWTYLFIALFAICFIGLEVLFHDGGLIGDFPRELIGLSYAVSTIGVLLSSIGVGGAGYFLLSNAESRLARETRRLEVANTYKSHFLASASHDLRQPLHALNLFVAQLNGESDPAERSRLISRINAAVGSMNELFEALLDMTKLEAGILKPSRADFPVVRLLERIEATFAEAARKKGLRLRVVGSDAWVSSDPMLLERIVLNLVSNAVRYTERGGVLVGCRRRGQVLRIDVCDTGAGIPEGERRNIFGELYQVSSPGQEREGIGLGLAIVDRLGRLLAHPVELDSRPGRGSRFSVSAPLATQPRNTAQTGSPSQVIADPARGKRIIVIDDDALVLDGMRGILQSWGCQVQTAISGAAALASLEQGSGPPDLIISDSRLTDGKTGIEAIEQLRRTVGARIPAFIITGDTAPEQLRAASAGGFHLLHKPVSPMALRTTLNRLLKARDGGTSAR